MSAEKGRELMLSMMGQESFERISKRNELFPAWGRWTTEVLFGDVWQRPQLDRRLRSCVTVAVVAALGRTRELELHLRGAMANGLSFQELAEIIQHVGFYAGWPAGAHGLTILAKLVENGAISLDDGNSEG